MNPVITVRGLSKRFGDLCAVDGLDMEIPAGQVYGFLGPNGSGKTTALRMMCGLLTPTAGDISVLGMSVPAEAAAVRRRLGYMTQRFSLYQDLTARQNLDFLARVQGLSRKQRHARIAALIREYDLEGFSAKLAGSLSGGEKRKLALAAAVIHEPRLLILDEPTSEVDPNTRRYFWDALFSMCEAGTTVLVTTHLMDEAERCHHLAVMDRGRKVADDTPTALKKALGVAAFAVQADDLAALRAVLAAHPEVRSVTQTGQSLRVLLPDTLHDVAGWMSTVLEGRLAGVHWEPTAATIEDVFVVRTGGGRAR